MAPSLMFSQVNSTTFRSERAKTHFLHFCAVWRPQAAHVRPGLCFPMSIRRLDTWGAQSGKSAKSALFSKKCTFYSQNHRFRLGKHKGWSTWVAWGRQVVQKSKKCVLGRSDRNYRQQPSVKSLRGIICQKVKEMLKFQKIKKMQKVTFAFRHTCTAFLLDLGAQNRKSAKSCTFCTLALPNRPSRTFAYVYDVFARSGRSEITFCAFGAKSR